MKKNIILITLIMFLFTACAINNTNNTWDESFGGVNKSYDSELLKMRDEISPKFQKLKFEDKITGKTMEYNLFIPKDYDKKKSYPLVLFMADDSTVGKGVTAPLMQGYGGIIWASDESQEKNPAFVLVPSFSGPMPVTNDDWEVTSELEIAHRLLDSIVNNYKIDKTRLYVTGQSMGGMISFYLNATYTDLFAASIFVGSQWNIEVLEPLSKIKFFYIISEGDTKASKGMDELIDLFQSEDVKYSFTKFDATLNDKEKDEKIENLLKEGSDRNFVQFTKETVVPKDTIISAGAEHMYSFDYAYKLNAVRDWLFKQSKKSVKDVIKGRKIATTALKYFNGRELKQDYKKAREFFEEASNMGDTKSPRYLGIIYEEGLGVDKDYKKALKYYKEASNMGDITASVKIGNMYEKGLGVEQNYEDAIKWYFKAAPSPEESKKNLYPRMDAIVKLGYFYENGYGIEKNIQTAITWYELAAKRGNKDARAALKRLK